MLKERSAGAIIFRREPEKKYYLLLHYDGGHWDFPKGNIEKGEEPEETAVREIKEETGITDLRFLPDFRETITYFYKREGQTVFKQVIFFLAETTEKEVKISWEHQGFEWLDYHQALERLTFENARNLLRSAASG
jgi:bis(5'-nucleosidyl)-tetraphosphatase